MAEDKSDVSKHMSRWGGGYITAAQMIVEKFCECLAEQQGKTLSDQFWNKPEWKSLFILQLVQANKLLKEYSPSVVLAVVGSKDMRYKRVRSLGARYLLDPLLKAAQAANAPVTPVEIDESAEIKLRQPNTPSKSNLKNKLKGL